MGQRREAYTAGVVLAAGAARRFGSQKLLLPFHDSTVLGSVIASLEAAGVAPIVVVVGEDAAVAEWVTRDAPSARVAQNPRPDQGMLSSVRLGVAALPPEVERFVLALGDQPAVRGEDIAQLLCEHSRSGRGIALPTHRGKRGHPVVFAARYREEILGGEGSGFETLRDLIHAHHDEVAEVECASDAVLRDLDTKEQYEDELRRADSS